MLDELGLEPGPELRELEQRILVHDPALAAPGPAEQAPVPPTPTFGRDADVRAVLHALAETRLLTLAGTGGVGKTRLAIEVARAAGGRFVALAPIVAADRIPAVVCDALGVVRATDEPGAVALDRALARGPLLLVLDNLEHLPDAAPLIAGLLERHPALTVLATSRHPLRVRAERLYPVAPLTAAAAAELFTDRAQARGATFLADDAVAEICERVGRLPLAIELAAARLRVLTPSRLAERLGNELGVLDRGPRDAPERQRTLRATLDWSYGLLENEERRAVGALGAFAGGCDVDAAEAVTASPLTALEGLVDKSLVTAAGGRLVMLEPVRQYAVERLAERPDADAVRLRHLRHYLSVAQRCEEPVWVRSWLRHRSASGTRSGRRRAPKGGAWRPTQPWPTRSSRRSAPAAESSSPRRCHVRRSPLVMGAVTTTTGGTAMLEKVFYTSVLVSDQDDALDFYTNVLGLEKRVENPTPDGPRFLTVGVKGDDFQLVLWPGTPGQAEPAMGRPPASITIETDDCRKTVEELQSRGVEFVSDVLEFPWGYVAQFQDPDGNRLQVRQGR